MRERRAVGWTALLLVGLVGVLGLALAPGVLAQSPDANATEASFGAQISAFGQASAADADGAMDRGMWAAGVDGDGPPGQAVRERARELETRLEALENLSASLEAANGSGVAYTARASAVHARLGNLRESVDQTMATAERHGVNATALADLRRAAGNATGPEIAAIARNLTDAGRSPPPWAGAGDGGPGGPPTDSPGATRGNATSDNGGGRPDDPGQSSGPENPGDGGAKGGSGR